MKNKENIGSVTFFSTNGYSGIDVVKEETFEGSGVKKATVHCHIAGNNAASNAEVRFNLLDRKKLLEISQMFADAAEQIEED